MINTELDCQDTCTEGGLAADPGCLVSCKHLSVTATDVVGALLSCIILQGSLNCSLSTSFYLLEIPSFTHNKACF